MIRWGANCTRAFSQFADYVVNSASSRRNFLQCDKDLVS